MTLLLTPWEVDRLLRYPRGRAARLAKAGRIPSITLPDGEIRFAEQEIERLVTPTIRTTDERREVTLVG